MFVFAVIIIEIIKLIEIGLYFKLKSQKDNNFKNVDDKRLKDILQKYSDSKRLLKRTVLFDTLIIICLSIITFL